MLHATKAARLPAAPRSARPSAGLVEGGNVVHGRVTGERERAIRPQLDARHVCQGEAHV